jgi:pimeloyl-ACP methyl ester carboxylesterase
VLLAPGHPERVAAAARFEEVLDTHTGWDRWNRDYWLHSYPDFLRFFFSQCFTEPDSDAQIEHFLRMGLKTTPEVLLATLGTAEFSLTPDRAVDAAHHVRCPSLVIHGDEDHITPIARGEALARLTGAEFIRMPGSGHEPECRAPDAVDQHIRSFLESVGFGGRVPG